MILVAGSANIDFVTQVAHIPAPGETVLGGDYRLSPGGKGANQAVACARAGQPGAAGVTFLGALGHDAFADTLRASLAGSGVVDRTLLLDRPTGAAFISVSGAGENAITVASGANAALLPEHLPSLQGVTHMVLQLEVPPQTVDAYAAAARAAGAQVILNAAPMRALSADLLRNVDLLVVNEGELRQLLSGSGLEAGGPDLHAQLAAALDLGPSAVLVTLGERGSLAARRVEGSLSLTEVPPHPVRVVDTTGAGDTYVGVLVSALSEGLPLERAMRRASVGAALACTREGAQPSMPLRAEIEAAMSSP
ncbi:ribokinase [Deinococcus aquiradiocola]|uniref:Ribokinase n=1 Tax=Deinococcus aquiradiocola TaxID=393059 RepID=A0A917P8J0_9DEIO|nr:ribokinase [Deinococcus aquiradiocola]GGJ66760.1 ribokinase [Deinococcus aquiradiocola]